MKTVIINDGEYKAWHEEMSITCMPIAKNKIKRIPLGIAKVAAVGKFCGCGEKLCCIEDMGGFCIGIIGFNRGDCKRVVCSECHKAKVNCPFCQIKAEAESWTAIERGVKQSGKRPLTFSVSMPNQNKLKIKEAAATTPQTGGTTCEKLTQSSTPSKKASKRDSPHAHSDRLLIGSAIGTPEAIAATQLAISPVIVQVTATTQDQESVSNVEVDNNNSLEVVPSVTATTQDQESVSNVEVDSNNSLVVVPSVTATTQDQESVSNVEVDSNNSLVVVPSVTATTQDRDPKDYNPCYPLGWSSGVVPVKATVKDQDGEFSKIHHVRSDLLEPLQETPSSVTATTQDQESVNKVDENSSLLARTVRFQSPLNHKENFNLVNSEGEEIIQTTEFYDGDEAVDYSSDGSHDGTKLGDQNIGQKKPSRRCATELQYYCGSSLRENCVVYQKPLDNIRDCPKCEECMVEYICPCCFFEYNIHKCYICVMDSSLNINCNNIPPITIDDDSNNVEEDDDAYVTDSEKKVMRQKNIDKRLDRKLRISSIIATVNAKVVNNSNNNSSSNFTRNSNHFKVVTDLSVDDDQIEDSTRVMLQIGKAGQGNGVIQGYQSDIDCLRSDPELPDRAKYMTSSTMDYLTTYHTDKLPLKYGRDIVHQLPSWFWQVISGTDPTYSAFLGGKTLKEIKELFTYRLIQFDVFERGHISTVAVTNLHSVTWSDFDNRPIREKPEILCMDTLEAYHDYDYIAQLVIAFLQYALSVITEMDKELTIPELQLSQHDIDKRIDIIDCILYRVLPTFSQETGIDCGIGALEDKRRLALKFIEFVKDTDNDNKDSKRKNSGGGRKKTKKSSKPLSEETTQETPIDGQNNNNSKSLNVSFSSTWDISYSCTSDEMIAYRIFYYCFLLKQSEIYLFYEPFDNKSFVMTDKMKEDHNNNMISLEQSTRQFERLHKKHFVVDNPPGTDINSPTAKHIIEPLGKVWTINGINFGYISGGFENYESHLAMVEGLDNTMLPKNRVYNCLPWDYKKWPTYYSFGMWGAMKIGDQIYFSKCMYRNIETGELVYGARLLSTMCVSPNSKMLVMDKAMLQISFIDEKIIRLLQALIYSQIDKDEYERRTNEQAKSAKVVYVHDAGFKRKTKLYFLPDGDMLDSERRDPNCLFDKDHVDIEGLRDRAAFNCYVAALETQYGSVLQGEDLNGNTIRKSMRSKQKTAVIDLVEEKKSNDKKKTTNAHDDHPMVVNIDDDDDDNDEDGLPHPPSRPSASIGKRGPYKRKQTVVNSNSKETLKSSDEKTKKSKLNNDNNSKILTTPLSSNNDDGYIYSNNNDDYNDYDNNNVNLHLEYNTNKHHKKSHDTRSICSNLSNNSNSNNNNSKISKNNNNNNNIDNTGNVSGESMMENILKTLQQSIAQQQSEFITQQLQKEKELLERNDQLQNKLDQILIQQKPQNEKVVQSSNNNKKVFKRPNNQSLPSNQQPSIRIGIAERKTNPSSKLNNNKNKVNSTNPIRMNNNESTFQNDNYHQQYTPNNSSNYNYNNDNFNVFQQQQQPPRQYHNQQQQQQHHQQQQQRQHLNRHYTPNNSAVTSVDSIMGLFFESRNESLLQQLEQRNFENRLRRNFDNNSNNYNNYNNNSNFM